MRVDADLLSRPLKKARDQDLGHQVSRPRPWPPGLETKTKTLVIRSRYQNLIVGLKYLCIYVYKCMYVCMNVCVYVTYGMYICIYVCMQVYQLAMLSIIADRVCVCVCVYACLYV